MLPRLWTLTALVLGSCEQVREPEVLRGLAMGTTYEVKFVLPDQVSNRGFVETRIREELARFDAVFSTYDSESEISRFNRHDTGEAFSASEEFRDLAGRALELAQKTDGAFDPTLGPVLRLYGFGPGADEHPDRPSDALIDEARERTGWRKIRVTPEGSMFKADGGVELDLNAIAKGAGVDRISSALDALGCGSYMVEIGGEVRCRGIKPDGGDWTIGVRGPVDLEPRRQGLFIARVPLRDRAMATSGSYYQYRQLGEGRVHHILDPRSGRNAATEVDSVTVVAETCELADGLATALMVLGPKEGERVLARFADDDVRVLFHLRGSRTGAGRTVEHRWTFR